MDFSKAEKKILRQLSGTAYERELKAELKKLIPHLLQLESGTLTTFDVEEKVHEFHDKTSRQLYGFYVIQNNPLYAVARGLAMQIIEPSEIPQNLLQKMEGARQVFASGFGASDSRD